LSNSIRRFFPVILSAAKDLRGAICLILFLLAQPAFAMDDDIVFAPSSGGSVNNCTLSFNDGGTTRYVGQQCFSHDVGSCPPASSPADPYTYGADPTGAADSTSALNSAIAAGGDVVFGHAGTYLINFCSDCTGSGAPWSFCTGSHVCSGLSNIGVNGGFSYGVKLPANIKLEGSAFNANGTPAVELYTTIANAGTDAAMITTNGGGETICGLDFQQNNTQAGPAPLGPAPGQALVMINNSNVTLEDSSFENAWGDAAVIVEDDYTNVAPSGVTIRYLSGNHNPTYMVNTDSSNGVTIENVYSIDASIGGEYDGCSNVSPAINHSNLYQYNYVSGVNGNCAIASGNQSSCAGVFLGISADDWPPGCNYSSNTVSHNYCTETSGLSSSQAMYIHSEGSGLNFPNSSCTGSGAPYACCTGSGTGNCQASGAMATYTSDNLGANCSCNGVGPPC
jgi:hypothetical protein